MKPLDQTPEDDFGRLLRQAVALPDAPPALLQHALDLWPTAQRAGPVQALFRQVAALLSFDSWSAPALAAGVRAPRSASRHLLYSAEGRDIDLRITPVDSAFVLTGQVLGPDGSGQVELSQPERASDARRAELDALGEFRIEGIAAGDYALTLRLGSDEIVLPTIRVGAISM
jgi:hypothetical protein